MRPLLFTLLFAALECPAQFIPFPGPGIGAATPSTITVISSTGNASSGFFPNTVTTGSINTTGSSILVASCSVRNGNNQGNVSDSQSNSWTLILTEGNGSGTSAYYVSTYYVVSPSTSATHTFSCSGNSGSGLPSMGVIAAKGTAISSVVDCYNGTLTNSVTLTPTQNYDLFVAVNTTNGGAPSYPTGWTGVYQVGTNSTVNSGFAIAYFIQNTGASALTPAFTSNGQYSAGACFKVL